jgi:hypothetical protein
MTFVSVLSKTFPGKTAFPPGKAEERIKLLAL